MALKAGLTGGIGSGKSTVAAIFRRLMIPVIDADQISHELTAPQGAALALIRAHWGDTVFEADGSLSRPALRAIIFESVDAKRQLEAIMHPLIYAQIMLQFNQHAQYADIVIFDIPLLAESPTWREQLDRILVIDCSEQTQIQRVMNRSKWSKEHIQAVIAQQATRQERQAIATDIIFNDNLSLDDLEQEVKHTLSHWKNQLKNP